MIHNKDKNSKNEAKYGRRKGTRNAEIEKVWLDKDLVYAATARCNCGAGLAYVPAEARPGGSMLFWDCSEILTGRAVPSSQPGYKFHSPQYPFIYFEIVSEDQPSARRTGFTTRPGAASGAAPAASGGSNPGWQDRDVPSEWR